MDRTSKSDLSSPGRTVEIHRPGISGFVLRLLGFRYSGARLTGDGITLHSRKPVELTFDHIAAEIKVGRKLGFRALLIECKNSRFLTIAGVKTVDTEDFAKRANDAWHAYHRRFLEAEKEEIDELNDIVLRLENPQRYPSACLLEPFVQRAQSLISRLPRSIVYRHATSDQRLQFSRIRRLARTALNCRDRSIEAFVDGELSAMAEFFDQIESNPLTPEQRLAVITDEDATLVLAGAGSGKTSVITAKAAYLIKRGIRPPAQILLMAFGKDAAEEMSDRIQKRCGAPVAAMTFHALGYDILKRVEDQVPALAAHVSDEAQFRNLLKDILLNKVAKSPELGGILRRWFGEFYKPYKSEWDFSTRDEYYRYVETQELRTLQGELVRSFEELEIANWLFLNGIAYEYEPDYEHELPGNNRQAYTPDFRLKDSGIYIEHFGVRKEVDSDGTERFTTAPYVDRENYLKDMEWKRQVHHEHGTILVETYSYEQVEGRLTEALAQKIAEFINPQPIPTEEMFSKLQELGQVDSFTQILATFLRHFKSASSTIETCQKNLELAGDAVRANLFLKIFEPVFKAYQRRLGKRIDFEDMILLATEHVRSGRYKSPYRHLLVDEFQDISHGRAELLLALKEQHPDARIFAVGDDWQSIFRFTGSDIHLMRTFGATFGGVFAGTTGVHKTIDLGRTFRSVDKIALPARSFVLKNPSQIEKKVSPAGYVNAPAIKIVYYSGKQTAEALRIALEQIGRVDPGTERTSVLLLGRYHFVRPRNLADLQRAYPELDMRFMTVHGSKGLEADHVIVLQLTSGQLGFPSEIVDDPILEMVLPEAETFDHAEERRLFYVALTRARASVTLLASRERSSVFVEELETHEEYDAVVIEGAGVAEHACHACKGKMLRKSAKKSGRTYFACEHGFLCGEMIWPCPACEQDLPQADTSDPDKMVCSCGASYFACPSCDTGWMVPRKGRYGKFLSCIRFPECSGKMRMEIEPET